MGPGRGKTALTRLDGEEAEDVGSEFFALLACETPDDLHRVVVLWPPERRTADTLLPMMLLGRSHAAGPSATLVTALLLLTDVRWRLAARDEQIEVGRWSGARPMATLAAGERCQVGPRDPSAAAMPLTICSAMSTTATASLSVMSGRSAG